MNNMKNLFELSEEQKNEIRMLHETYNKRPGTRLIWEQTEDVTLNKLNEKIKNVLLLNQAKVQQDIVVTISPQGDNMQIDLVSRTNPKNTNSIIVPEFQYGVWRKEGIDLDLTFNTLKLSEVYSEIFKDEPTLKQLYDSNSSVKSQMDSAFVPLIVEVKNGVISISNNDYNRRNIRRNNKFVKGDSITFDKFYKNNGADFGLRRINSILAVETSNINSYLGEVKINKTGDVPPPPPPVTIPDYEFTLTDVFNFDTIDLKDPTKLDTEIENFKRFMVRAIGKGKFLDILNTDVVIKGYASSDGDPSEKVTGKYAPCSDSATRGDYDKCLSQKRAEVVANKLNDAIKTIPFTLYGKPSTLGAAYPDSTTNWARAEGMGQDSSQSKIDWTTEHDPKETAKDRRIVFTPKLII
jgi:hypothetical protein